MAEPQVSLTNGQANGHPETRRDCGTPEHNSLLVATDPEYKSRRLAVQQFNRLFQRSESLQPGITESLRGGTYSIPVVFHIVYNTAEKNISDAQIDSQIAVLNADFNAANADRSILPSVFESLVGNAHISFYRARKDPRGLPTDGVTRTPTAVAAFNHRDNGVKFSRTGGADGWPSDRYLNIWVSDLAGVFGYAQFPGGPAVTDGVAIDFVCFGTMGTAKPPTDLGRNATHEVGHWLDCFHIWGDDETLCSGTDHCKIHAERPA